MQDKDPFNQESAFGGTPWGGTEQDKQPFGTEYSSEMFGDMETTLLDSSPQWEQGVQELDTISEPMQLNEDFGSIAGDIPQSRPDPFKLEPDTWNTDEAEQLEEHDVQSKPKNIPQEGNTTGFWSGLSIGLNILALVYIADTVYKLVVN